MATAVKTSRSVQATATQSAGSTTTGSAVDLTTALGMVVTAKCTNGATGPTLAATVRVQVSNDGSDWMDYAGGAQSFDLGNNAVSHRTFLIGPEVMHARTVFSGNTGQSVTIEADGHELTSIG